MGIVSTHTLTNTRTRDTISTVSDDIPTLGIGRPCGDVVCHLLWLVYVPTLHTSMATSAAIHRVTFSTFRTIFHGLLNLNFSFFPTNEPR